MSLKERIKEIRNHFGLTQKKFGERLDVSRGVVAKWEIGDVEPDAMALGKIHDRLGTDLDWLKYGVGDMFGNPDDELQASIDLIVTGKNDSRKSLIKKIVSLPDDEIDIFERFLDSWEKGRGH